MGAEPADAPLDHRELVVVARTERRELDADRAIEARACQHLDGVIEALAARDYEGWLMVEQDSCWGAPSESETT